MSSCGNTANIAASCGFNNNTNINNIKSIYILKKIFKCECEKKILNIVKYNKKLQNIFYYNIDDYKKNTSTRITIVLSNSKECHKLLKYDKYDNEILPLF